MRFQVKQLISFDAAQLSRAQFFFDFHIEQSRETHKIGRHAQGKKRKKNIILLIKSEDAARK